MADKSPERLAAEIDGLRQRSDDRLENVNARLLSTHDSIGVLRGRAEENATNIQTIRTELQGIRGAIEDVSRDLEKVEGRVEKGIEEIKEDWSDWIEGIATKFKWTAGLLVPLVLGVLGLVLR